MSPARRSTVLLVGSLDASLVRFRGALIERLVGEGHRVLAAAPRIGPETDARLRSMGAEPRCYPLASDGLNPFADLRTLRALVRTIRAEGVDLVVPYTVKPVVYGSLAARLCGVRAISLISGLGRTFVDGAGARGAIRSVLVRLYRLALRDNAAIVFQNVEDRELFAATGILHPSVPTAIVAGSGVDLAEFPERARREPTAPRFAMVARLLEEKGVMLYAQAARDLRRAHPDARFELIGDPLPGASSSVDERRLDGYVTDGSIVRLGWRNDLPRLLAECDVFVLPTWYGEGVPRSILEALATGLAVVTTDTPGCRTTVEDGVNGLLVPPRDQQALTEALGRLIDAPDTVVSMGRASRRLAERRFDVHRVNDAMLAVIAEHAPPPSKVEPVPKSTGSAL